MKIKNFSTVADADQFNSLLAAKNIPSVFFAYNTAGYSDDAYEDDLKYSKVIVCYPFDVNLSNPRDTVERFFPAIEMVTGEKILSIGNMISDEEYIWCRLEGELSIFDFELIKKNSFNALTTEAYLTYGGKK